MFVKYSCDCIAIKTDDNVIILRSCDDPEYQYTIHPNHRVEDFKKKTYKKLNNEEYTDVMIEMNNLLRQGYELRTIKQALGVK